MVHEAGLAQQVIDTCASELRARGAKSATRVGLRIGALSAVDPDALIFCFDALKPNTPLHSASLQIEWRAASESFQEATALNLRFLEFDTESDA